LFRDNSLLEFDPFSKHFLSVMSSGPKCSPYQRRVLQEALVIAKGSFGWAAQEMREREYAQAAK